MYAYVGIITRCCWFLASCGFVGRHQQRPGSSNVAGWERLLSSSPRQGAEGWGWMWALVSPWRKNCFSNMVRKLQLLSFVTWYARDTKWWTQVSFQNLWHVRKVLSTGQQVRLGSMSTTMTTTRWLIHTMPNVRRLLRGQTKNKFALPTESKCFLSWKDWTPKMLRFRNIWEVFGVEKLFAKETFFWVQCRTPYH